MKPKNFQSCLRKTALVSLPIGLMLLSLPMPNAQAGNWNQFDVCVGQLQDSGVAADKAGTACSGALIPKELS